MTTMVTQNINNYYKTFQDDRIIILFTLQTIKIPVLIRKLTSLST